jgi:hypothetical protein
MYIMLFLIPALVGISIARLVWPHAFTWKEVAIQAVPTAIVITLIFVLSDLMQTGDTQLVNGEVVELEPRKRMCPIGWVSYPDSHCTEYRTRQVKVGETCTTDSKGRRSCTPIYQTEYNYYYPWERRYFVNSDVDRTFEIRREDPQGVRTPARFAIIEIGDPVTVARRYTNYIAAAAHSLFNKGEALEPINLSYPRIRDYYHADRVLTDGWSDPSVDLRAWNARLEELNRDIRKSGANALVLLTSDPSRNWSERLAKTWDAHNINDLVVSIGMDGATGTDIRWVDVRSWSGKSLVNIQIRDALMDLDKLDAEAVNEIIRDAVEQAYVLKSMDDFEYLADDIPPPLWALILAFIGLLIVTPVLSYLFITRIDIR